MYGTNVEVSERVGNIIKIIAELLNVENLGVQMHDVEKPSVWIQQVIIITNTI